MGRNNIPTVVALAGIHTSPPSPLQHTYAAGIPPAAGGHCPVCTYYRNNGHLQAFRGGDTPRPVPSEPAHAGVVIAAGLAADAGIAGEAEAVLLAVAHGDQSQRHLQLISSALPPPSGRYR